MNLTMKDKDFNPLIGRTGVDVGKSFSGKDWKVTARAALATSLTCLPTVKPYCVMRPVRNVSKVKKTVVCS